MTTSTVNTEKPSKNCETPIELNEIRQSLDKISDTGLALDLLQKIEVLETTFKERDEIANSMTKEAERLRDVNQRLYLQVTAHNLTPPPNSNVDYNGISNVQDIINHI